MNNILAELDTQGRRKVFEAFETIFSFKKLNGKFPTSKERPGKQISSQLRRLGIKWKDFIAWASIEAEALESPNPISFIDKKRQKELDPDTWINRIMDHIEVNQELHSDMSLSQDTAEIAIDTDLPIAVGLSSDWHLGSRTVDYRTWQQHFAFFVSTPELYMGTVGDLPDNTLTNFRSATAIFNQVINPKEQKFLIEKIVDKLVDTNTLLFGAWGNHDVERDENLLGDSAFAKLLAKQVPYFNGKGFVKLKVGEQTYTIAITHKSRFSSFLHDTHSAMREYEMYFPADVIVTAHHHSPAIAWRIRYPTARRLGYEFGGGSWLVRTGTYEVDSGYSKRYYGMGEIGVPTAVFFPDRHEVIVFQSPFQAITFITGCRVMR